MKQQINLYTYLPSAGQWKFSPPRLVYIYGLLILILLMEFSYSILKLQQQNKTLNVISAQLKSEEKELSELTQRYPMINPKDLQGTVQQLTKQLNQRIKLAALLSQKQGFSLFFKKLSQTIFPTVWLNEISIDSEERKIILRGFSIQALNIQLFLETLNKNKGYQNITLDLQNVTKIKNQKNYTFLSFEASNKTAIKP